MVVGDDIAEKVTTPTGPAEARMPAPMIRCSVLMDRARIGRAPGDRPAHEGRPVTRARDIEIARHVAGVGAAAPAEDSQRGAHRLVQLAALIGADGDCRSQRIDARAPQRFVDKKVAQSRNAGGASLVQIPAPKGHDRYGWSAGPHGVSLPFFLRARHLEG